jgi:predicted enzyme related to lactoylglutathione lyase
MELHTTDQDAAKKFYGSLFGWEATDYPMGPEEVYTIFRLQGKDCSAACTLRKDLREHGVPPHWMLYIAVDNADESTKRAKDLGAQVMAGPFDVAQNGRMSVIQDPAGGHFCLWQGNQTPGIGIGGENNTFCWADINTKDREGVRKFYEALFSWAFVPGKDKNETGYLHIMNGQEMIGGTPPPEMLPPGIPTHWLVYYMVADCDASTAKARGLGAQVFVEPMAIEGAGWMSIMEDPQGASFALFQMMAG